MSGNWLDSSSSSNLSIQTYVKGFVDMSGGNLILRNNSIFVSAGDVSLNGRLFATNDASLKSRLFVGSDVSLGGNLYVTNSSTLNGNVTINGNLIAVYPGNTIPRTAIIGGVGTDYSTTDASMGQRLYVQGNSYLAIQQGPLTTYSPNTATISSSSWSSSGITWSTSESSNFAGFGYSAFAASNAQNVWFSTGPYNSTSPGLFTGATSTTVQTIGAVTGDWLQLTSAQSLVLNNHSFYTQNNGNNNVGNLPYKYYIVGSNDGSTWYPIQYTTFTSLPVASSTSTSTQTTGTYKLAISSTTQLAASITAYPTTTTPYTYFRIIVTNILANAYSITTPNSSGTIFGLNIQFTSTYVPITYVGIGTLTPLATLDVSGTVRIASDTSLNGGLYVAKKAVFNSDISANGNVVIFGNLSVQQATNTNFINTTVTNYQLVVTNDISLNGRLFVSSDASLNSRLYVSSDTSLNGSLYVAKRTILNGDASLNGNVTILGNLLATYPAASIPASAIIGNVTTGITTNFTTDISMNGNLYITGTSILNGDVSLNNRLIVSGPTYLATGTQPVYSPVTPDASSAIITGGSWSNNGLTWTASASTIANATFAAYKSFYYPTTGNPWACINAGTYNSASPGEYRRSISTTIQNVGAVTGEWLQIQSSNPVVMSSYYFTTQNNGNVNINGLPLTYYIIGSNDNTTWYPIHYVTFTSLPVASATSSATQNTGTYNVTPYSGAQSAASVTAYTTSTNTYSYFRIIVTNIIASAFSVTNTITTNSPIFYWNIQFGNSIGNGPAFVGIGKVNPTYTLDISGTLRTTSDVSVNGNVVIAGNLYATYPASSIPSSAIIGGVATSNFTTDVSMNQRLVVLQDTSLNGNLYVAKRTILNADVSLNGDVTIAGNTKIAGNLLATFPASSIPSSAIIGGIITTNYTTDVSLNQRLFVVQDVSLNGNLYIARRTIHNADSSFNGNVTITGNLTATYPASSIPSSAIIGGIITTNYTTDVSLNQRLFVTQDTSLNGNLYVAKKAVFASDISMNGNLVVYGNLTVQQASNNVNFINTTVTNYQLVVTDDISLNGRLLVSSDVSLGSNLYIARRTVLNADSSFNGNVTITGNLTATYPASSIPSSAIIGGIITTNYTTDVSINQRLFVLQDTSLNGNLYIAKRTILNSDASLNGNVTIVGNLIATYPASSIPSSAIIGGVITSNFTTDVSINQRLFVTQDTSLNGNLYVGKKAVFASDISMNGNLVVYGNLTVQQASNNVNFINTTVTNYQLVVTDDISLNGRLLVSADASFGGNLYIAKRTIHNADASFNGNVTITGNLTATYAASSIPQSAIIGGVGTAGSSNFTTDVSINQRLLVLGNSYLGTQQQPFLTTSLATPSNNTNTSLTWTNNNITWTSSDSGNYAGGVSNQGFGTFSSQGWLSNAAYTFTNSTGNYTGATATTVQTLGTVNGEWLQIQSNQAISMASYSFSTSSNGINNVAGLPNNYYILGSNNGTTWFAIQNAVFTSLPVASASSTAQQTTGTYTITATSGTQLAATITGYATSTNTYTYFRIVTTNMITPTRYSLTNTTDNGGRVNFIWNLQFNAQVTVYGPAYIGIGTATPQYVLDVSGTLRTTSDASLNGNLYVQNKAILNGDVSMNSNLFVQSKAFLNNDVSMNGNLYVQSKATLNGDVSMNGNLFLKTGSLYVGGATFTGGSSNFTTDVSINQRLFVTQDTSLNGNLYVARRAIFNSDISMNGNLVVYGNLTVQQASNNVSIINTSVTNYQLVVTDDISLNGRLNTSSDASLGGNLFVQSKSTFNNDVSMNGNLFLKTGSLYVGGATFTGGSSNFTTDVSINQRLFVTQDVSFNGNLYIAKRTVHNADSSFNGNVTITGNLTATYPASSIPQSAIIGGVGGGGSSSSNFTTDVSMNQRLLVLQDVSFNGNLYVAGRTIINGDTSMNGNVSMNATTYAFLQAIASPTSASFTQISIPGTTPNSWNSFIGISSTGQYMLLVDSSNKKLYLSTNYGSTVTLVSGVSLLNLGFPSISSTGQYMLVAFYGGVSYLSIDYGTTFTSLSGVGGFSSGNSNFTCASVSSTGQYMLTCANGGAVYLSSTYGATWSSVTSLGSNAWGTVAVSGTGQYMLATPYYTGTTFIPYLSTNYGATFATVSTLPTANYRSCAISANGQYMLITGSDVYLSINSGTTWSAIGVSLNGGDNYQCSFISSTGKYMWIAAQNTAKPLYYSANFGSTWTVVSGWGAQGQAVALSANSEYVAFHTGSASYVMSNFVVNSLTNAMSINMNTSSVAIGKSITTSQYTLDISGTFRVSSDASLNGNVTIGNLFVRGITSLSGDVSMNSRLFVAQDASLNGNLYVAKKAVFASDISMNGNLVVYGNLTVQQASNNVNFINTTVTNYQLVITDDISLNGRLRVSSDTSLNGNLYVQSKSTFNNDVSMNGNLYLKTGSLYVGGATFTGGSSNFTTDVSINQRLFVIQDVSFNGNLYVQSKSILNGDVSMNGNLYIGGTTTHYNDTSFNGNVSIGSSALSSSNYGTVTSSSFALIPGQTGAGYAQVAMSNNGQYMLIPNNANLNISTNYGATFTPITGVSVNSGCCISASGQYMFAQSGGASAYLSTNYGSTWTTTPSGLVASAQYAYSAMSFSGQYILTCVTNGSVYLSINYGTSFTAISTTLGTRVWGSVAISGNGQYMLATSLYSTTGFAFLSTNNGSTWTSITALTNAAASSGYRSSAISQTGQYMLVVGPNVWLSGNYGVNWTSLSSLPASYYNGAAISNDGQIMWVANQIGTSPLYYSTNYGINWTLIAPGLPAINSVSISSNSQYVLASNGGQIYLLSTFGLPSRLNISTYSNFITDVSINGNLYVSNITSLAAQGSLNLATFAQTWTQSSLNSTYTGLWLSPGMSLTNTGTGVAGHYINGQTPTGIWITTNYGQTWTQSSKTTGHWWGVQIAANGTYAIATAYQVETGIWYSRNSGQTWTAATGATGQFNDCAISANGQYGIAANGSAVYMSTNYGETWTSKYTGTAHYVAISDDGQKAIFVAQGNNNPIYYTTNGGTSWTASATGALNTGWFNLSMNGSGINAIAGSSANGIYYSSNGGQTWSASTITSGQWCCYMSRTTGQYCVAGPQSGATTGIYYSTNYGQTWTQSAGRTTGTYQGITISPNGQYQLTAPNTGYNPPSVALGILYSATALNIVPGQTTINSKLTAITDVSINGNLLLNAGSLYVGGLLFTGGSSNFTTDVSLNQRLYVIQDTSLNGNLYVAKKAIFAGDISANGNLVVYGNLIVQQASNSLNIINTSITNYQLVVTDDISLNGRLFTSSDVSINGRLFVSGSGQSIIGTDTSFGGNVTFSKNMVVNGLVQVNNDLSLNGNLTSEGNTFLKQNVTVTGSSILNGLVQLNNDLSLNGNLTSDGNTFLKQDVTVTGNSTLNRLLTVNGNSILNGNLIVAGISTMNGLLLLNNDLSLNGNLTSDGNTFLKQDVTVSGISNLNGLVIMNNDASLNRNLTVAGNTSINGLVAMNNDASLNGNLTVAGNTSINGLVAINSDASLNRNLTVAGNTIINGSVQINNDASLNGNVFTSGNIQTSQELTVANTARLQGDVAVGNNLYVTNDLLLGGNFNVENYLGIGTSTPQFAVDAVAGGVNCGRVVQFGSDGYNVVTNSSSNSVDSVSNGFNKYLDLSLNARLFIDSDVKFNSRLFVTGPVSLNSTLLVGQDAAINGRLFLAQDASLGGKIFVNNDASFNGRLFLAQDASLGGKIFVNNDASINSRLFVGQDTILNGRLLLAQDASINGRLFVTASADFAVLPTTSQQTPTLPNHLATKYYVDTSLSNFITAASATYTTLSGVLSNANTFTAKTTFANDVSMGGNLVLYGNLTVQQGTNNLNFINTTVTNYQLVVTDDISLNGRLFTSGNIATNSNVITNNLFVNQDASFNGRFYVGGDVSLNSRLFVNQDASFNGNLTIGKYLKVTSTSEKVATGPVYDTSMTFDMNQGSIFTVSPTNNTNFGVKLTNVPTDLNRTFVVTLIIDASRNNSYGNSLGINGNSTPIFYAGGAANIYNVSGGLITQTFAIINNATTAPWKVISAVTSNF